MNGNGCGNQKGRRGNAGAGGRGRGMCRNSAGTQAMATGFENGQGRGFCVTAGENSGADRISVQGDVFPQARDAGQTSPENGPCGRVRRRDGSCGQKS